MMSRDIKFHWQIQNNEILKLVFQKLVNQLYAPNLLQKISNFLGLEKVSRFVCEINASILLCYDYSGLEDLNKKQMIEYSEKILKKTCDSYNEKYKEELIDRVKYLYSNEYVK